MRTPLPIPRAFLAFGLLAFAGCSMTAPFDQAATMSRGMVQSEASLDDVTNGNDDNSSRGLDNGGTGFFYDDGGDGDVLGRTENLFRGSTRRPESKSRAAAPPAPRRDRKMIYASSYAVLVPAVDEAIKRLLQQTEAFDGYLAKRSDATLTVRVPAPRFKEFTAGLAKYGRILSESMSARDVTSQHTDLTIRLENAEKSRKRLLELLDKATEMEDILKIETALRRLTTEIEQMQGQLKLLDNQIAFSTVTVTFKSNAPKATPKRRRSNSRFYWINRIGIEQDLRRFQP